MVKQSIRSLAVLGLAFAMSSMLVAKDEKNTGNNRFDMSKILAEKLGLNDKQRQEMRQIHEEYEKKMEPMIHQLWTLHVQECEALKEGLTEQQRARLPQVLQTQA